MHLGLPICGDAKRLNFWAPLLDRIISGPSSWKTKNLSLDGHLILLKFVMSSLSIYFLSFSNVGVRFGIVRQMVLEDAC